MAELPALVVFWICISLLFHTYAAYPMWLLVARAVKGRRQERPGAGEPASVSVVVSVYNEHAHIANRIENILATRHPRERIEILVGSDGSDDGTNDALSRISRPGVRVYCYPGRRGKAAVLNDLVLEAGGEILVFTDANTVFDVETIPSLLTPFVHESVGGVCGELILGGGQAAVERDGEGTYWGYENRVKQLESDVGTILGASGGVYAIRRKLYHPLPIDKAVVDDFLIPLSVIRQGYRVLYNSAARARELTAGSVGGEFKRKVRIGTANFFAIREFRDLLHPRWGFVAFALWSHKMIRWFAPVLLLTLAGVSLAGMGSSEFFRWCVILEGCFAGLALLGAVAERLGVRIPFLVLPYYFLAMNAALFVGMVKFLLDVRRPHWDVVR